MHARNYDGEPSAVTILPGIELRLYPIENLRQILTTANYTGLSDQAMDNLAKLIFKIDNNIMAVARIGLPIISGSPPELIANKSSLIMLTDLVKEGTIETIPILSINTH